jgi:UDP-glucose 4-epimerase
MKIVITGALGHIGSFIIREFNTQFPNAKLVMIDNLMTKRYTSLFNLPPKGQYQFIEGDVTQMDLRAVFKDAFVIIHLAAITDAAGSFENASELEANNYTATLKVAEACVATGARLISLSSTSVYGTQNEVVSEDCSPDELKPQSPYAITKLKEEELVSNFCKSKGLKGISCRFGTIYGVSPGMRFHTAVNKFCWQAAMGQPITVWRTAYDQKRPYLDLFDAARAFSFIIKNDIFDGRIYNVLTQNSTVRQIIDTIKEFVPDLKISFVDNQIMNQLSYEVSCSKFTNHGFTFKGDLRKSIGQTLKILEKLNSIKN